jgi:hypothetical protein
LIAVPAIVGDEDVTFITPEPGVNAHGAQRGDR